VSLGSEPAVLQTEPQPHAGAVQDDVAVAGGDGQFLADARCIKVQKLAHHEHAGCMVRQSRQAGLEDRPELLLGQGGFGIAPDVWPIFRPPVSPGVKKHREIVFIILVIAGQVGEWYRALPLAQVGEIHLAGFSIDHDAAGAELLIDTHGAPVDDAVWALYAFALQQLGPTPTLIERDQNIPPLPVLIAEAQHAERLLSGEPLVAEACA